MTKNALAYIDIGTKTTRVAFFSREKNTEQPILLGNSATESHGVRFGYISNNTEVIQNLRKTIQNVEKSSGFSTDYCILSISGTGLESTISTGTAIISKADQEVTQFDVDKAISEAENDLDLQNKKILYQSPIIFKVDGKEIPGKPEGVRGIKLEVKMFFVTCFAKHLDSALESLSISGLEVIDVIPGPISSASILLSESQKIAGVVLIDIGFDNTTFIVYENNVPVYLGSFGIGGNHITNDIALGLRVSLEEAEKIKLGNGNEIFSKKKLEEIIGSRLEEIFEKIDKHLKKIGRSGLLPAGAIFTGNGSLHPMTIDMAMRILQIPVRLAPLEIPNTKLKLRDLGYSCLFGLPFSSSINKKINTSSLWDSMKKIFTTTINQLTP